MLSTINSASVLDCIDSTAHVGRREQLRVFMQASYRPSPCRLSAELEDAATGNHSSHCYDLAMYFMQTACSMQLLRIRLQTSRAASIL
jgi:hypothetical protein